MIEIRVSYKFPSWTLTMPIRCRLAGGQPANSGIAEERSLGGLAVAPDGVGIFGLCLALSLRPHHACCTGTDHGFRRPNEMMPVSALPLVRLPQRSVFGPCGTPKVQLCLPIQGLIGSQPWLTASRGGLRHGPVIPRLPLACQSRRLPTNPFRSRRGDPCCLRPHRQ